VVGSADLAVPAASYEDLQALLAALKDPDAVPPSVVLLPLPDDDPLPATDAAASLLQAWSDEERLAGIRLVVVTRDAGPAGTDPYAAAVWGLVRRLQSERPDLRLALLDVDDESSPAIAQAVESGEPQTAVREGQVLVLRTRRINSDGAAPPIQGTVLVTGDDWAASVAAHLASAQPERDLVLAGMGTAPSYSPNDVRTVTVDLTDAAAVTGLIADLTAADPLAAIVHVISPEQSPQQAWASMLNLDEAVSGLPLERFAVVSQGDGSAAALGELLAARRHSAGLPALSLTCGRLPADLAIIDEALHQDGPRLLAIDPPTPTRRRRASSGRERPDDLAERLAGLTGEEQDRAVLDLVLAHAAAVLGHTETGTLEVGRGFLDLGFTSLTALELRNRLVTATGLQLPGTIVFDHPTPEALARQLRAELSPDPGDQLTAALSELDRLEKAVLTAAHDPEARTALRRRLQDTLAKLGGPGEDEAKSAGLGSASASEIFDFIDRELGRNATTGQPSGAHVD
jgi:hypothetical protein